jgi:hypothetical protein
MDQPLGLTCDHENCGRSFPTPGALGYHKRSCRPSKKRLQTALSRAKELWEVKKRARTTLAAPEVRVFVLAESAPFSLPPSQVCLENLLGSHQNENIRTLPQVRGLCPTIIFIPHL